MRGRMFKGVVAMPGSQMLALIEKGDTKAAEKLLKCVTRMADAYYDPKVVAQVRSENPDLY